MAKYYSLWAMQGLQEAAAASVAHSHTHGQSYMSRIATHACVGCCSSGSQREHIVHELQVAGHEHRDSAHPA